MKIYGYHQDLQHFGGYVTRYRSGYLWTIRNYVQEGNQSSDYTMYKFHLQKYGNKSTLLLQVF